MGADEPSPINRLVMPSPWVVLLAIHKTLHQCDMLSFNKLSESALPYTAEDYEQIMCKHEYTTDVALAFMYVLHAPLNVPLVESVAGGDHRW